MRPGVVFLGLFAILVVLYLLLADTLGRALTFLLEAAVIVSLVVAVVWFRRTRTGSWSPLSDDGEPEAPEAGSPENSTEAGKVNGA